MLVLNVVLLAIALAGALYLAAAMVRLVAYAQRPPVEIDDEFAPSISVLKPVAGLEPQLYEHLASFCVQRYPSFEVVFALHAADDPAIDVVRRVVADFPETKTRVAVGHNDAMANPKIANLAKPGVDPAGEIVVIADSDVLVTPEYLQAIAGEFATETTGATTCLYGGIPNGTLASRLGAQHVEDEFAPSVLVALAIGPLKFCLGATMAVRKTVLDALGGLQALGPYLADDHTLGELVARQGRAVTLCPYAVKTAIPETKLGELWSHELRWARTHKAHAPAGYFFSFVTYALPLAAIYALVSRNAAIALPVLAMVTALRFGVHAAARRALRITRGSDWWLVPIRDALSLGIWATSLFGRTVRWRDLNATVGKEGRFVSNDASTDISPT